MAEIKMVSCGNCGYEWQQGTDGSHQCSEHMVRTIKRQAVEIERLNAELSRERSAHEETRLARNRARLDGIAEALANLTPEIERLRAVLEDVVRAWESVPGGGMVHVNVIQRWLVKEMKPSIDKVREAWKDQK